MPPAEPQLGSGKQTREQKFLSVSAQHERARAWLDIGSQSTKRSHIAKINVRVAHDKSKQEERASPVAAGAIGVEGEGLRPLVQAARLKVVVLADNRFL